MSSGRESSGSARGRFWDLYARTYDQLARLQPYQDLVQECVDRVTEAEPARVIDLGCGTGNLIVAAGRQLPARFVGLDASEAMLRRARAKADPALDASFLRFDLDHDPIGDLGTFDVVVSMNVLYTAGDPAVFAATVAKLLAPGGTAIIVTPCADPDMIAIFRRHAAQRGWPSALKIMPSLIGVGLANLFITRSSDYHFLEESELTALFPGARVHRTYADQDWMAVWTPASS